MEGGMEAEEKAQGGRQAKPQGRGNGQQATGK